MFYLVTQNGSGDVLRFKDRNAALAYDKRSPVFSKPVQMADFYGQDALIRFFGRHGVKLNPMTVHKPHLQRVVDIQIAEQAWPNMEQIAKDPDPNNRQETEVSDKEVKEKKPKAAKEPKEPKQPKAPAEKRATPKKYFDNAVIRFAEDKNGNLYGPDNNPRRVGSMHYDKFGGLRDGMTIGEAKAAGIGTTHIRYFDEKAWISVEGGGDPIASQAAA